MPPPQGFVDGTGTRRVEAHQARTVTTAQPPPQQSGRYRLRFEGDPTLRPAARPDWWSYPPGRAFLLGRTLRPHNIAHRRHVGETS
jgi:hypothetical protein